LSYLAFNLKTALKQQSQTPVEPVENVGKV